MTRLDPGRERREGVRIPIGVVLDGPRPPAWQARVLKRLEDSRELVVEQLRLTSGAHHHTLARRLRAALERHVFAIADDPTDPVELVPREGAQAPRLTLWLAEGQQPSEELTGGLALLRHGDRFEPAENAFWRALLAGDSYVRSELLLIRDGTAQTVADTVSELRPYSETVSRALALWKLAAFVPRSLERSLAGASAPRAPAPASADESEQRASASAAAPWAPSAVSLPPASELGLLARSAVRAARAMLVRACFRRPWSIVVAEGEPSPESACRPADAGLVRWGEARMYADPFLFEHEGRHHLFCEEVPAGQARGVISHTELSADGGAAAAPTPVLQAAHHLSYPFVFSHEGEVFMIPETSAVRRVELYRARVFPEEWERHAVLLDDLDAADATLLAHEGLLWLFASVAAPGASTLDELHLFWAEKLRGPWRAHPLNPVVSDARCARPAGAIQRWGSRLVRPAQDCSRRYGWAISFRQIELLSTSGYAEREIDRVEPSALPGARAMHTYSSDTRFQTWDVRRREPRWTRLRRDSIRPNRRAAPPGRQPA